VKKILIAGAALAALIGTPALAADMALKAPPPVTPACEWCGWFIGLNAGWVGSTNNSITNTFNDPGATNFALLAAAGMFPSSVRLAESGFLGGAQIGYNWQTGNWLAGLEADFDGVSAKKSTTVAFPGGGGLVPTSYPFNRQLDWLSTIRARVGVLASPNFLLFVTGGVAIGEVKTGNAYICLTCAPPTTTEPSTVNTNTTTKAGGTIGGGFEWMIAPHWSIKAEYLYANLGRTNSTVTYTDPLVSTMTASVRNSYNIARAGVNWHF
jgi:outer membrane immunogenic protein